MISVFKEVHQPSVEIWGIKILEPITSLTDIMVSCVCFYAAYRIYREFHSLSKKDKYLHTLYILSVMYFLLMALATLLGGILGHAFLYLYGFRQKLFGWIISMASVVMLERYVIFSLRQQIGERIFRLLNYLNVMEFFVLLVVTLITLNFFIVEAHGSYGILFVTGGLELWDYIRRRSQTSLKMLKAVAWAVLTSIVHLTKFSVSPWFNYLDISHILMCITAWYFYNAVKYHLNKCASGIDQSVSDIVNV